MQNVKKVVQYIPKAIKSTLFNDGMYCVYMIVTLMIFWISFSESGFILGFLNAISGLIIYFVVLWVFISVLATVVVLLCALLMLIMNLLEWLVE